MAWCARVAVSSPTKSTDSRRLRQEYTEAMEITDPLEDWRGVDLSQINRQLLMTIEDRVNHMVDVANKLIAIRRTVRLVDLRQQ